MPVHQVGTPGHQCRQILLGTGLAPHRRAVHASRMMVWAPEVPPEPSTIARHAQLGICFSDCACTHTHTHTHTHTQQQSHGYTCTHMVCSYFIWRNWSFSVKVIIFKPHNNVTVTTTMKLLINSLYITSWFNSSFHSNLANISKSCFMSCT